MRYRKILCDQDYNEVQPYRNLLAAAFGPDEELLERPMLTGRETEYHRDWAFLAEDGGITAGGVHLTQERDKPALGSISGMIVRESYRRQGIAKELFAMAVKNFDEAGGQILYLGTGNPKAAALYRKFGFRFAPGSNVMFRDSALLPKTESAPGPEVLPTPLAGNASEGEKYRIEDLSPKMRLRIIPLVLWRGPDLLMDRNAMILSTSEFTQRSCMGLYPRFSEIAENGGRVVCAYDGEGDLCGVATAVLETEGLFVDVFAAPGHADCRTPLLAALIREGNAHARISDTDREKQDFFASMGFLKTEDTEAPSRICPLPVHRWIRPDPSAAALSSV